MGAWGVGNFDNDIACDWAYDLEECPDLSVIEKAVNAVFDEEYIDADVGCEALAAIDTLARLKGNSGVKNSYTEGIDNWVSSNKIDAPNELIEKSKKALSLVTSDSSELYELWEESEEFDNWKAEVKSLEETEHEAADHSDGNRFHFELGFRSSTCRPLRHGSTHLSGRRLPNHSYWRANHLRLL